MINNRSIDRQWDPVTKELSLIQTLISQAFMYQVPCTRLLFYITLMVFFNMVHTCGTFISSRHLDIIIFTPCLKTMDTWSHSHRKMPHKFSAHREDIPLFDVWNGNFALSSELNFLPAFNLQSTPMHHFLIVCDPYTLGQAFQNALSGMLPVLYLH